MLLSSDGHTAEWRDEAIRGVVHVGVLHLMGLPHVPLPATSLMTDTQLTSLIQPHCAHALTRRPRFSGGTQGDRHRYPRRLPLLTLRFPIYSGLSVAAPSRPNEMRNQTRRPFCPRHTVDRKGGQWPQELRPPAPP